MSQAGPRGEAPGAVRFRFSRRDGGVSGGSYAELNLADHVGDDAGAVNRNRGIFAEQLGVRPDRVAIMKPVHGRDVAVVVDGGSVPGVDALVTTRGDLGLLALGADCATVVMFDASAEVIAAVHSGWRGVVADAVGATVAVMSELGADPKRIRAEIGPAICPGCYEVSALVREEVADSAPDAAASTRWGTPAVDIHAGVAQQLRRAGVVDIGRDRACTFEDHNLYSFRRDGVTGRHGAMITRASRS